MKSVSESIQFNSMRGSFILFICLWLPTYFLTNAWVPSGKQNNEKDEYPLDANEFWMHTLFQNYTPAPPTEDPDADIYYPDLDVTTQKIDLDAIQPRTYIHSIYKFGWCTSDAMKPEYLRHTSHIFLSDWYSTQAPYIYLLAEKNTRRYEMTCVVMKMMVPRKYMFRRSRIPMHYCIGFVWLVMLTSYQRLEIHELYLQKNLNMPANLEFKFYHARPL